MYGKKQYSKTITAYGIYFDYNSMRGTFKRKVLTRVFINHSDAAVRRRGGLAEVRQVSISIPLFYNNGYIERRDFNLLPPDRLEDYWTIGAGADMTATRIIPRETDKEFGWLAKEQLEREIAEFDKEYGGHLYLAREIDTYLDCDRQLRQVVVVC